MRISTTDWARRMYRAQRDYPTFNWAAWNDAQTREIRKIERTEDEIMNDRALVATGNHLIEKTRWSDVDEVKRHVLAAYGHGSNKLDANEIAAVVAIAWTMQLDPNPGAGHLYAWRQGGKLCISPGYQGYIFKAQEQREFFYNPPRAMTEAERELHGLKPGEVGAVCELYDMKRGRMAKELGLPVTPILGIAVWKPGMNVANGKTGFWMASKNAIKDAIRQLGLGFTQSPTEVPGFAYNWEADTWEAQNANNDYRDAIEGETIGGDDDLRRELAAKTNGNGSDEPRTTNEKPENSGEGVMVVDIDPDEGQDETASENDNASGENTGAENVENGKNARPYSQVELVERLKALALAYGKGKPGMLDGLGDTEIRSLAMSMGKITKGVKLGDKHRKALLKDAWGVDSYKDISLAMSQALYRWIDDAEMAKTEFAAYATAQVVEVVQDEAA